jgi:hypothetical protein
MQFHANVYELILIKSSEYMSLLLWGGAGHAVA